MNRGNVWPAGFVPENTAAQATIAAGGASNPRRPDAVAKEGNGPFRGQKRQSSRRGRRGRQRKKSGNGDTQSRSRAGESDRPSSSSFHHRHQPVVLDQQRPQPQFCPPPMWSAEGEAAVAFVSFDQPSSPPGPHQQLRRHGGGTGRRNPTSCCNRRTWCRRIAMALLAPMALLTAVSLVAAVVEPGGACP